MEPSPSLAGSQSSSGKTHLFFFSFSFCWSLGVLFLAVNSSMPISINISFKTNVIICFNACDFPSLKRITGECRLCLVQDDVTALVNILTIIQPCHFFRFLLIFKGQAKAWRGNSLSDTRTFLFPQQNKIPSPLLLNSWAAFSLWPPAQGVWKVFCCCGSVEIQITSVWINYVVRLLILPEEKAAENFAELS